MKGSQPLGAAVCASVSPELWEGGLWVPVVIRGTQHTEWHVHIVSSGLGGVR